MKKYHVLQVTYRHTSMKLGLEDRIVISSELMNETVVIPCSYDYDGYLEQAMEYLVQVFDFEILGFGTSKDGYYIISTTFKTIKDQ